MDSLGSRSQPVRRTKTRIIVVLVILIIVILVMVFLWKSRSKRSQSEESKSEKSSHERRLVGTSDPNDLTLDLGTSLRLKGYNLILSPYLEEQRAKIFPFFIHQIELASDLHLEPEYPALLEGLKHFPRAPTQEELTFLLKYRKFLDRSDVYSMCGPNDIEQIYVLMLSVAANKVPGDLVETGVWKGGMGMWMKALINHFRNSGIDTLYAEQDKRGRRLWLFDVFGPFPEPAALPMTDGSEIPPHQNDLTVHNLTKIMYQNPPTVYQVREHFTQLGLLDDDIKLVKGLFNQSLPIVLRPFSSNLTDPADANKIRSIAILRIDNDYYDSVLYVLEKLYPRVSKGGLVVIDDYNNPVLGCKDAVHHFRQKYHIENTIYDKYGGSIYWQV